jgi:hypothetical protein
MGKVLEIQGVLIEYVDLCCILIKKCPKRAFLTVAAASRCWVRGFWGSAGGARSAPHAPFEVGASDPKPAGALVLVKPTQVALAAAHQTRPRRSVGKCARSAPWILASVAARFRKRPVLSHGALAGAVASFCAACQENKKSRRRSCFIADGPFYYFGRLKRHGA